jgi:hypothetical protein
VILLLGTDIALHISCEVITSDHIILVFVGILATFIVVSNYAQVKEIENKFDRKAKELEDILDERISRATNNLAKIAMQKDCEGNILANIQNVAVLSQTTDADSIVTAISYCALNIREIREIKKSDFVNIQEGDYPLGNFIETIKINMDKNFFENAEIDTLKVFLKRIEGITGTDTEMNDLAEIKNKVYKIVTKKEDTGS